MPVATAQCIALHGAIGHVIDVQADVSPGLVGVTVVGRPDKSLNEGRDRCRMASVNSNLKWPTTRRTTVLLSPAELAKNGTHFDLAMAVAILVAAEPEDNRDVALNGSVFLGELTLDGGLRCVPGVLPMAMAAQSAGARRVFVPEPQSDEAAMVPGLEVYGVRSLNQTIAVLRGEEIPEAPPVAAMSAQRLLSWRGQGRREELDMSDLHGVAEPRFALEVAAAGGHHLMLSGPKGAGKTSLAERMPGILPDLDRDEALELTALYSLAGALDPGDSLITRPPFSAPHHGASRTSLLGGGTGQVRPGEVSRAHSGVLLLDEFPLFPADVIEGLREPLENGDISIARGEDKVTFPARGMVVMACNPCPCGDYHADAGQNRCICSEVRRRDYRRKITGPITDRIDIMRHVSPVQPYEIHDVTATPEDSTTLRERVSRARQRQQLRYAGTTWRLNAHAPGPALQEHWPLPADAQRLVEDQLYSAQLTRRGATRVHRLSWTVADLAGREHPTLADTACALSLRMGEPLPSAALRRAG